MDAGVELDDELEESPPPPQATKTSEMLNRYSGFNEIIKSY